MLKQQDDCNKTASGTSSLSGRVILLTDSCVFAGTERHILDLSRALSLHGLKPVIGCPTNASLGQMAGEYGIETITREKRFYAAGMVACLTKMLRARDLDLIHVHNGVSHLMATTAITLAGRGKCVATQHFIAPKRSTRRGLSATLANAVHSWAGNRTAHFIAISQAVANVFEQYCRAEQLTVVPNGIFSSVGNVRSPEDVRKQLAIPQESELIVSASRLEPEKSVNVLIYAMRKVVEQFPGCVCVIAGDGQLKESLQRLIDDSGLSSSVRLLGFQEDVQSLMNAADVFVLASACEGLGLVILEAMSLAKPVVGAGAGGPLELIENEVSGLLFAPGDSAALADCIKRLLRDQAAANRVAHAGQQRAIKTFSADQMAQRTMSIYHAVLED
ncbi:MAG TPA: glycosyltransferase family 4 protein [Trichormus sp.]